jgi:hypothetical protein
MCSTTESNTRLFAPPNSTITGFGFEKRSNAAMNRRLIMGRENREVTGLC